MFDTVENKALEAVQFDLAEKRELLHRETESKLKPKDGIYQNVHSDVSKNVARWLGVNDVSEAETWRSFEAAKQMLNGVENDGQKTLGLKDISKWKINPEYQDQNLKQHAGYAAEVISTTKENMLSQRNGLKIKTFRADDRPDLFSKNDQYVDKIRVNQNGEILERIQTKFVGKDGASCLSKLASKSYDKYFNDGKVDKIEIPNDYYDKIKKENLIGNRIKNLEKQLERVQADSSEEVIKSVQNRIDRYNKIDQMIERSTVSSKEAEYATRKPQRYTAKLFAKDLALAGNEVGSKSGIVAAGLTFTTSAVDHVSDFIDGKISTEKMIAEIVKETGAAGVLGYGTAFISTAVSHALSQSSSTLIRKVGGSCFPAAVVSFAVDSYDSISDFAQGQIVTSELACDLGKSATSIAGSFTGGAAVGGVAGSVGGPVGTAIGGIVGGVVGCAVATEAYETAVKLGAEGAQVLGNKAEEFANSTVELVKEHIPDKLNDVKIAFNDFARECKLPFNV